MNLLDGLKQNNTITNTKGGKYYETTYNSNLDLFAKASRYNTKAELIKLFNDAYAENKELALANLLYYLDIRNGKGERYIFKTIFKSLCQNYPDSALKILPFIGSLGRYDYILEGIDTPINDDVISLIKEQLELDKESSNPSLLAKWLPSHRTHNQNNLLAKKIEKGLGISEKEYRKMLSTLRSKINIVEKNLTERSYGKIEFASVPAKAMLKYNKAFNKYLAYTFSEYKESVKKGNAQINTNGLFAYEIIKKVLNNKDDLDLCNLMWENQKDVLQGCESNVLVVADTSGSMTYPNMLPFSTAIGLALYTAERNKGVFQNHFITFSSEPRLCEIKGQNIWEKVHNIKYIVENTDIDKVFALLLKTAKENSLTDKDMPSHLLIISDMEFDDGVYSKGGTNFSGWKKAFADAGYKLPTIIFWNVAAYINGLPVTKFDNDVAMVSGFSTNILENLLTLEKYSPIGIMMEKLDIYLKMLKSN